MLIAEITYLEFFFSSPIEDEPRVRAEVYYLHLKPKTGSKNASSMYTTSM